MKKAVIILMISIFSFSCAELELSDPVNQTSSSFWETEKDLYEGVIATYDRYQDFVIDNHRFYSALLSDEGTNEVPYEFYSVARFQLPELNWYFDQWLMYYQVIGRAYQVIERAPKVEGDEVERLTAEAKFLAAMAYYNLIIPFGEEIAYVDGIQTVGRPRRAKPGELWDFTEQMLKDAIPDLPVDVNIEQYGRATKAAAQVMLARVYMQQHEYELAEPLLSEVINSGKYSLNSNYEDNFLETGNVNPESVFQFNFLHKGSSSDADESFYFMTLWGDDLQPTNFVKESYLSEDDKDGNIDPRMNVTLFWSGSDRTFHGRTHEQWLNQTQFPVLNKEVDTEFMKYSEQEALADNPDPSQALDEDGGTDYIYIRYADVLLLYAETLNELGQTADAYQYVDMVRARSNMSLLAEAYPEIGNNKELFLEQLKHERLVELAGEGLRFYDLIRWGDYGPESAENDPNFETFTVGQDELWPIPQIELDLNTNLKQNPGY